MSQPTTPTLFTPAQLAALVGEHTLPADVYDTIHGWVLAEVQSEIGEVPQPIPPGVLAVALQQGRAKALNRRALASKSIGPLTETYRIDKAIHGNPGLTHQQRITLRGAVGGTGAFSVQTGVPNTTEATA